MKLWQKLTLAVIAAAIAAVITVFALKSLVREKTASGYIAQTRSVKEMQACTSDAECTVVNKGCCSCGETLVINKMFTDDYRKSLRCHETVCTMQFCEIPQNSKCVQNVCVN